MKNQMSSFDFLRAPERLALFLFPALFIIALLFPPLLLLIPAAFLVALLSLPEHASPVIVRALSSAVRLPGRRSPPSGV